MRKEIWKDIEDYGGLYEVSNMGRVKSLKRMRLCKRGGLCPVPERVLKPATDRYGYLYVNLYKEGKKKLHNIHRLVAQAFIPNPYNLPQVNHRDKNPLNNRVENLEFCTPQYNIDYSLSKFVLQYTVDEELVREWTSTHEAARLGGYNQSHISACCSGKRKTHKGYIWKYKKVS